MSSYRRGRKGSIYNVSVIAIIIALIVGIVFFFRKQISFGIFNIFNMGNNSGKNTQVTQDVKDSEKKDELSEEEKQELAKKEEEERLRKEEEEKIKYKPGTSHNNEATAWAYSTKDVNQWILKPSTYTGEDKLVFLTFDDGPSEIHTATVLDILKNYGVHATFFIIGRAADGEHAKPLLQRQIAEGHAVGLHTYSHEYSFLYPHRVANVNNILLEVDKNLKSIRKSLGEEFNTPILRYPGGHMSWKQMGPADEALAQRNIYNIDWNVLTGDAEAKGSRRDIQGALENVKEDMAMYGGSPKVVVLLMHDIKAKSVDALPSIIEYYQSLGYKFCILS